MNSFKGIPNFQRSLLPYNPALSNLTQEVKDVYEIPTGGKYLVSEGIPVGKFDILLSGIAFYDYLTDPDKINSIVTASGTQQQYDVTVVPNFENELGFNLGSLSEDVVWTGSVLQTTNTVLDDSNNYIDNPNVEPATATDSSAGSGSQGGGY